MKSLVAILIFCVSSAAFAQNCFNGISFETWTQTQVSPRNVTFGIETGEIYHLNAKIDQRVTELTHSYQARCGRNLDEAARKETMQNAATALQTAATRVEKDVNLHGLIFDESALTLSAQKRIAKITQISDSESVTAYSNPAMQKLLDGCREIQQQAIAAGKDMILTPYGYIVGASLCTVAP